MTLSRAGFLRRMAAGAMAGMLGLDLLSRHPKVQAPKERYPTPIHGQALKLEAGEELGLYDIVALDEHGRVVRAAGGSRVLGVVAEGAAPPGQVTVRMNMAAGELVDAAFEAGYEGPWEMYAQADLGVRL